MTHTLLTLATGAAILLAAAFSIFSDSDALATCEQVHSHATCFQALNR